MSTTSPQRDPKYTFFSIDPTAVNLPSLALQHKSLRLSALQLSPDAFSSTYASEHELPDSAWRSRLRTPGKTVFVCSTTHADCSTDGEFVAVVTLIGPLTASAFNLPAAAGQPPLQPDDVEERWQLSSLYTLPAHRGRSLARKLCEFAIADLRARSRHPELRVRLMARPENGAAIQLYEKIGFAHSGKCTLEEALEANGEAESLPDKSALNDEGENGEDLRRRYRTRRGVVMQLVVKRD